MQFSVLRLSICLAALGLLFWSYLNIFGYETTGGFLPVATRIIRGEQFGTGEIEAVLRSIDENAAVRSCDDTLLISLLIITSYDASLETGVVDILREDQERADRVQRIAQSTALCSPYQSFAWFSLFASRVRGQGLDSKALELLSASYRFGAREPWIAIWRNRLALRAFKHLSSALQSSAANEFADLLQAGLVDLSAESFIGSDAVARGRLVQRIASLPVQSRKRFARALAGRGAEVPQSLDETGQPRYFGDD